MKVSICIISYNNSLHIADAIDGALMQEADFDFEIIIGEDASTDSTAEIVQRYQRNHPDKIRVISHTKNQGAIHNRKTTMEAAHGEYIALCDGDDFWTDQNKLADQVAFLEANPDHTGSCTQARVEWHGHLDKRLLTHYAPTKESYESDEVLNGVFLPATASLVFRKADIIPLPTWFCNLGYGDRAIRGMLAKRGKFHCLQRKAVTYRCNNWGAWQKLREQGKAHIKQARETIDSHLATYQPITA